jgi:hypothetical protein
MKAVCTTLGCCAAAAAPAAETELPFGDVLPMSPFVDWPSAWLGRVLVPFRVGGPMEAGGVGEMSMGSRGGASIELEGRIGMDLCRLGLCGSGEKGLLRASAMADAMAQVGRVSSQPY